MATNVVGRLRTDLICNTTRFITGMKQAGAATLQFSREASKAGREAARAFKAASIYAKSMIGSMGLGTIGIAYSFVRITRAVEEFNQAMASSTAIMGSLSDSMRDKLIGAAHDVAFATKFSATETAKAYYYLTSAGLDVAQSIKALPVVATFAQAGMFDLSRATDLLTDSQMAMGLSSTDAATNMKNMTRVGDVLVKANVLANASVEQFSEALTNKAAGALRMVNKDIEEGVAVLAAYASVGVKGAEAGTALSIVMRDLQTKAIENAATFRKYNVAVYDSKGNMRNTAAIVRDLENAMSGLNDITKKQILLELGFSDKSIAYTQVIVGMSDAIAQYEAQLRKASGTMAEVSEKQLPELTKGWGKLKDAMFEAVQGNSGAVSGLGRLLGDMGSMIRQIRMVDTKRNMATYREFKKTNPDKAAEIFKKHVGWGGAFTADYAGMAREIEGLNTAALPGIMSQGPGAKGTGSTMPFNPAVGNALGSLIGKGMLMFMGARVKVENALGGAFKSGVKGAAGGLFQPGADKAARASMFAETMSPFEEFTKKVADAARLLSVGALDPKTYERAAKLYRKELDDTFQQAPTSLQFTGGAGKGSIEAYSAIVRAMGQDSAKKMALDLQRQQLAEAKASSRTLTQINAGLKGEAVNLDNL